MPLPAKVGKAIAAYLRRGRPPLCESSSVHSRVMRRGLVLPIQVRSRRSSNAPWPTLE
jgi:hypothetical protein